MKNAALALLASPKGPKEKSDGDKDETKPKGGGSVKKIKLSAARDILAAETPEDLVGPLSEFIKACTSEDDY